MLVYPLYSSTHAELFQAHEMLIICESNMLLSNNDTCFLPICCLNMIMQFQRKQQYIAAGSSFPAIKCTQSIRLKEEKKLEIYCGNSCFQVLLENVYFVTTVACFDNVHLV